MGGKLRSLSNVHRSIVVTDLTFRKIHPGDQSIFEKKNDHRKRSAENLTRILLLNGYSTLRLGLVNLTQASPSNSEANLDRGSKQTL
jgi:hypothetical protein